MAIDGWLGSFGCFPRSVCPSVYFIFICYIHILGLGYIRMSIWCRALTPDKYHRQPWHVPKFGCDAYCFFLPRIWYLTNRCCDLFACFFAKEFTGGVFYWVFFHETPYVSKTWFLSKPSTWGVTTTATLPTPAEPEVRLGGLRSLRSRRAGQCLDGLWLGYQGDGKTRKLQWWWTTHGEKDNLTCFLIPQEKECRHVYKRLHGGVRSLQPVWKSMIQITR